MADKFKAQLQEIAEQVGKSTTDKIANLVYQESQNRCPVNTGKLKASGYKQEVKKGYEVGYTADYALQIDQLPQSLSNGTAHFLSGVLAQALKEGLS
jgi:hypothetical protein